jgi:large-conductance mechanosensitive channel
MISFLLEEGVITVGTLSGLFTTALLNSLKTNIIDPSIENIVPSPKPNNPPQVPSTKDKSEFGDMFPIPTGPTGGPPADPLQKKVIKWKIFLKDLLTWIIVMAILYFVWKNVLHPIKVFNRRG